MREWCVSAYCESGESYMSTVLLDSLPLAHSLPLRVPARALPGRELHQRGFQLPPGEICLASLLVDQRQQLL